MEPTVIELPGGSRHVEARASIMFRPWRVRLIDESTDTTVAEMAGVNRVSEVTIEAITTLPGPFSVRVSTLS